MVNICSARVRSAEGVAGHCVGSEASVQGEMSLGSTPKKTPACCCGVGSDCLAGVGASRSTLNRVRVEVLMPWFTVLLFLVGVVTQPFPVYD